MSVLYRAVWSDTGEPGVPSVNKQANIVAAWATETSDAIPLSEGTTDLALSQGRQRTIVHREVGPHAFEVIVNDQKVEEGTEWTTVIRIISDGGKSHVLVETSMDSVDLTRRVSIGRPRVVHELLVAANKPTLGASVLLTEQLPIPANGIEILTEKLEDRSRALPIIVCSEPGGQRDNSWYDVANKIASRTEGIALVITLDSGAVSAFKDSFGALAIWGGGVRVYVPVPVSPISEGWRHRYYTRGRLEASPQATIDRIVYSVAQLSARRRVPKVFGAFNDHAGSSAAETIPISELDDARERWEFEYDLALEERSELDKELASANGHLSRLKRELINRDLSDLLWGTKHEEVGSVPDEVQDTSEAVLAAQTYLNDWLSLPESAAQELEEIDTAPEAYSWGNTAWRGLRALAAYAEDRASGWESGGFWEWCASGPVLGWPATPKKLAMTEGEGVRNNDKLKAARVFDIDGAVDSSGKIVMLAHLKVAEGGGRLAPRIYFYDDTGGVTGRVHVGFVGPHHLVPNKSTN